MTIKPAVAPTQKRVGGTTNADNENKESAHSTHGGQVVGVDVTNSHNNQKVGRGGARNVVIDGHGKSPQRRNEVYDDLARHRRSPHKSTRNKRREHHEHLKGVRNEREKHTNVVVTNSAANKCNSPHAHAVGNAGVISSGGSSPSSSGSVGGKSPEHLGAMPVLGCQSPKTQTVTQVAANLIQAVEETFSGYNSGDEHLQPKEAAITADEWQRRDEQFAKCMEDRGYILKAVEEDGACLFRSISLQIYGDEEMHDVIRQHTMDYIYKNREYFCHFVTEDINSYIKRKRRKDSHGNHIEIQAMSEIYSRPVEVYCYKPTPINIFNSEQLNNGYAPLRLSYQRGSHYNAIIDPYNATVGVGLGLAGYKPELQTKEAELLTEQLEIEQTMFEDKLKTTDWEATNEAIEEQVARESYLQWCRDNLHKSRTTASSSAAATGASTSATVTSAEATAAATSRIGAALEASALQYSMNLNNNNNAAAATINLTNVDVDGLTAAATIVKTPNTSTNLATTLEESFNLHQLPKNLLSHKKSDSSSSGSAAGSENGYDSDDTDMSSTSSIGKAGGSKSSPNAYASRRKKSKLRGTAMRGSKKQRREKHLNTTVLNKSTAARCLDNLETVKRSPIRDTAATETTARAYTPEAEQQPCTSKQSNTPEKLKNAKNANTDKQPPTSFYQELLEASYATDGFGQLSESEMLQRAIQLSTQDYIEEQKRKYYYRP